MGKYHEPFNAPGVEKILRAVGKSRGHHRDHLFLRMTLEKK